MAANGDYKKRVVDALLERKLKGVGAVLVEGPKWCVKTFGELFDLDVETVLGTKNAGVKTVREILELRDGISRRVNWRGCRIAVGAR